MLERAHRILPAMSSSGFSSECERTLTFIETRSSPLGGARRRDPISVYSFIHSFELTISKLEIPNENWLTEEHSVNRFFLRTTQRDFVASLNDYFLSICVKVKQSRDNDGLREETIFDKYNIRARQRFAQLRRHSSGKLSELRVRYSSHRALRETENSTGCSESFLFWGNDGCTSRMADR